MRFSLLEADVMANTFSFHHDAKCCSWLHFSQSSSYILTFFEVISMKGSTRLVSQKRKIPGLVRQTFLQDSRNRNARGLITDRTSHWPRQQLRRGKRRSTRRGGLGGDRSHATTRLNQLLHCSSPSASWSPICLLSFHFLFSIFIL